MKYIILYFALILFVTMGCSMKNLCENYNTDANVFRSSAMEKGKNVSFAEEKALFSAKQKIAEQVDDYIKTNYELHTLLEDRTYEIRIRTARKNVLNNIEIVCKRNTSSKGLVYSHVAIEISKKDIDKYVKRILTEEFE